MLVYTRQKNIAQAFILERYFFISIYPVDVGDSKNRLSPICHHDKTLILNSLDVNGDR